MCDDIVVHRLTLRAILLNATLKERHAMMKPREIEQWRELPEIFPVYRGCYQFNRDGLSWSLSRATAAGFPALLRYAQRDHSPLLLTGHVARASIVLKLDREESEVIAPHVRRVSAERLSIGGTIVGEA